MTKKETSYYAASPYDNGYLVSAMGFKRKPPARSFYTDSKPNIALWLRGYDSYKAKQK